MFIKVILKYDKSFILLILFPPHLYENEYFTDNICVGKDSQNNLENALNSCHILQYIYI